MLSNDFLFGLVFLDQDLNNAIRLHSYVNMQQVTDDMFVFLCCCSPNRLIIG